MTSNGWIGIIKSRAKSVQETAKSQLGKLTETVDKKLQEVQSELEKQRSKAEASERENQVVERWRPSVENPDGQIIPVPKPATPPVPIVTSSSLPISQSSIPDEELPVVAHRSKRSSTKKNGHDTDSGSERRKRTKRKVNIAEIEDCLNDIISEIVNREVNEERLNNLTNTISDADELVESTICIPIEQDNELLNVDEQLMNVDKELTNIDEIQKSDLEDNFMLEKEDSVSSKTESDQENRSINELSPVVNVDEASVTHIDQENTSINTNLNELPIVTYNDESLDIPNDSHEDHAMTSENETEIVPNELEDSFDQFNTSTIRVNRPIEKPPEPPAALTELQDFISQIEINEDADQDQDQELSSLKVEIPVSNDIADNPSEQLNINDSEEEKEAAIPVSIPDETQEQIIDVPEDIADTFSNEFSPEDNNQEISAVTLKPEVVELNRFSLVNCHSIPEKTKVHQITCSSTYIYICTSEHKIIYTKIHADDMKLQFKWMQHSELAEQLVVSPSNQTVWRLFNKRIYSSIDSTKFPPIGSHWNEIPITRGRSLLSISITDQCGWYIKDDGALWLTRLDKENYESFNVACPFYLNRVFCSSDKVAVATNDGEILVRVGCTNDCPEGDGWIFVQHNFGLIDDFKLLNFEDIISIMDNKNRLWIHKWSSDKGFFEVLYSDEFFTLYDHYSICVNSKLLLITDGEEKIYSLSECVAGIQWKLVEENTRLQRLIAAFSNEDSVWALTADRMICSSTGQVLEKPARAQYVTQATFVPDSTSQGTFLWALDESCSIYVRANVECNTKWEQLDQSQFEWNRRLVNIVCNNSGVWAVDDRGHIHFRHGHISASDHAYLHEYSLLPPAWISIPGTPKRNRNFSQIFCGPADWMVYATDNKQTVYVRFGINDENPIGSSWEPYEDCSALELAFSQHTLWLLTSCGEIQCRENISIRSPIGTRSTTLPGRFLSLCVSIDDRQVWALDSKRNLLKLDRLTVLFEK